MTDMPRKGIVPVEDTALAVAATGGRGQSVASLDGPDADRSHPEPTIADLGPSFRHITLERARGRSKRSSDHSFAARLRDVDGALPHALTGRKDFHAVTRAVRDVAGTRATG